jgi:hypothetical protein
MPQTGIIVWSALPWKDIIPRVVLFAHRLIRRRAFAGTETSAEDLAWSAIEKTLSGQRPWDVKRIGLVEHLMGVVSSDLYNSVRKAAHLSLEQLYESAADSIPSDEDSPEEIAIRRSETLNVLSFLREKDEKLAELATVTVLFGVTRAEELADLLNLSLNQVYELRRKLRRTLESYGKATDTQVKGSVR